MGRAPAPPGAHSPAATADAALLPGPQTLLQLFIAFTQIALQGFGGVLTIVQREVVERRRWLAREEFLEEWAVAQIMPGPNVVNLGMVLGHRFFGLRGAVVAVAGLLALPMVVVLALAVGYGRWGSLPAVAGALRGMAAVAAGLIMATAIKLLPALRTHPLGWPLCAAFAALCFAGIALFRWPLIDVLLVVGGASCLLTWRRLAP